MHFPSLREDSFSDSPSTFILLPFYFIGLSTEIPSFLFQLHQKHSIYLAAYRSLTITSSQQPCFKTRSRINKSFSFSGWHLLVFNIAQRKSYYGIPKKWVIFSSFWGETDIQKAMSTSFINHILCTTSKRERWWWWLWKSCSG